ncbi:MAG: hypothetical protein D8M58_01510 [Calditrichaeota bacterium]|nr:MAG: hypothetical protein DWQ03_05570 [Calditrichota bacterium]MBL1204046.1 hypothetical protein [Calditrichota bacterium]NOG43877.1 hypothetical protein [Calditrichota bacterium]
MMRWLKKGQIFDPSDRFPWMKAYAQVPTAIVVEGVLRIFFTTRGLPDEDDQYISRIGFIDVNPVNLSEVLYVHDQPVLNHGKPGTFDAFGVMPGSIHFSQDKQEIELYYTGWARRTDVPFSTQIGCATTKDNGRTFSRKHIGPLLGLDSQNPYLINGPFSYFDNGMQHIWYASGKEWIFANGKYEIVYQIKHAVKRDRYHWEREKGFCVPARITNEAQNRPVVQKLNDKFHMWYCYREALGFRENDGAGYRLGHAVSDDLASWKLDDNFTGLELSESGWDSEMMAYPFIITVMNKTYLFYNGNYFGKNGFGYAELTGV